MRGGLFVIGVLAAATARAAAAPAVIAQAKTDVDGDGVADEVKLTTEGVVVVASQAHREATFAMVVKKGRIAADHGWIAVEVDADRGVEGIGLKYKSGGLTQVWRGPIGPQGVDGEYRIDLTATGGQLVRHQSRADIRRCDGKPALLFAEGWDDAKRTFRSLRLTAMVDAGAPVVTAKKVTDPAPRPVAFAAVAASSGGQASDAGALVAPRELDDGDLKTAWSEDRSGDGRGEFVTYRATVRGESARALWLSPDAGKSANRIKRLAVVGAERAYWVDIPDDGGTAYRIDLPEPIAECVSVVIGDVKKGKGATGGGTTAIAELVVLGDADLAPGGAEAALVADVIAGGAGAHGAAEMLSRRGEPAAKAVVAALDGNVAKDARIRLLKVLMKGRHPAGAGAIATGISTVLTGPDLDDATRALAAMGAQAVIALAGLAADRKAGQDAREAALGALAKIPGAEATAALVGAAGSGPRGVRGAMTRALSQRPIAELLAAAGKPPGDAAAHADLIRGLGLAALHASAADRAAALDVMTAALAAANDYEGRYRAIQGIAALGDDAALGALGTSLGKLAAGTETSALHQVAALALARNEAPAATTLLVALAAHADPGVRLRAISALAQRTPDAGAGTAIDDEIDAVLAGVLGGDRWPDLRRAAAGSLGERCQRAGPAAALVAAVDGDHELEVRGDALAGLVACKATGIADRLIAVATDDKLPLPLRERAVILTVALGDSRLERPLIELFERWRGAAYESTEALVLAQRAAVALGRLGGAKAGAALEAALGDEALPELVSAAAAGLGELGKACPKSALADLRELEASAQQMIAASAKRAAARCGK